MTQPRTLSDLRTELNARLGFAQQQVTGGPVGTLFDSFLQDAQEELYWQYTWDELRYIWAVPCVASQNLYAVPPLYTSTPVGYAPTLEPRKILSVHCVVGTQWRPMQEGIDPALYTISVTPTFPLRYARRGNQKQTDNPQMVSPIFEVWPTPSGTPTLQFEGYQQLMPFAADGDYSTLDARMVFLYALAMAKAHLSQPDANAAAQAANAYLAKMRAADHGQRRYIPGDSRAAYLPPLPVLVNP